VSGALLDDADRAISGARVLVTIVAEDGLSVDAQPCDGASALPVAQPGRVWGVATDADGTFCARAEARPGTTHVTVSWAGSPLIAGTQATFAVDATRRTVTLVFDPEPGVLALGEGPRVVHALARVAEDGAPASAAALHLRLSDERGVALGDATTDSLGRAELVVPPAALGPPGPGELRLAFDGDPRNAAAEVRAACERQVVVSVSPRTTEGTDGSIPAVGEDDGAGIDLVVRSATGDPIPSGSVEALFDGAVIGVARVEGGRAHLVVRWPTGAATRLDARYVPDVPWFVAAPPTLLVVHVHGTGPWRQAILALAGAAILASFVASRYRLRPPRPRLSFDPDASVDLERVELLSTHADLARGWEGHVVDAHDRSAVAGAVVAIERTSFGAVQTLATSTSDTDGGFALQPIDLQPGDRLVAHAPLHSAVTRPLAARGVLEVALVSRRRSLLRTLVRWARARGAPFDARPEPTPAHVRRAAGEDARTASWAAAVENAAFGMRAVDADVEAKVDRLGHETTERESLPAPRR